MLIVDVVSAFSPHMNVCVQGSLVRALCDA